MLESIGSRHSAIRVGGQMEVPKLTKSWQGSSLLTVVRGNFTVARVPLPTVRALRGLVLLIAIFINIYTEKYEYIIYLLTKKYTCNTIVIEMPGFARIGFGYRSDVIRMGGRMLLD